jgi:hypothetical protein
MARGVHHAKGGALKVFKVAGGGASSGLTVTGIATDDVLLGVVAERFSTLGQFKTCLNLLSVSSIDAADSVLCTTATTGYAVTVYYEDVDA